MDATAFGTYDLLDKIVLTTVDGTEILLSDVYEGNPFFNLWGEKGSFSVKVDGSIAPIQTVTIKEGAQFPSKAYSDGNGETRIAYVATEDVVFNYNGTPADNNFNISWTKEQKLETVTEGTKATKITGRPPELTRAISTE